MKQYRCISSHTAFTLIEIVIAIAVLFIGIISIFSLFPAAYRMAELSKMSTVTTLFAQSKMDECIAVGFANIPEGTRTFTQEELQHIVVDGSQRNRLRNSTITVTNEGLNPLNNQPVLKKITLTVLYEIRSGKEKKELFITYISNPLHA